LSTSDMVPTVLRRPGMGGRWRSASAGGRWSIRSTSGRWACESRRRLYVLRLSRTSVRLRRTTCRSRAASCPIPTRRRLPRSSRAHVDVDMTQVVMPGSTDVDGRRQRPGRW